MKAILFRAHGGPDVLSFEDIAKPDPGPFDVVVHVKAAALNHLDIFNRRGMPGVKIPFPHVSGCEGAGEVAAVGSEVTGWKEGDRVVITPSSSCNHCEFCINQQDSMCMNYSMAGVHRQGCFAEYVSVPAETLYRLPSHLSYAEAASMPLVFLTAWHMLVSRAHIRLGEDVLVQAAGSGVGIAAIQIAKLFHARVIVTASSDQKLEKAKGLGADMLINYAQTDFSEEVRRITSKRGVDLIVEHTGAENWEKNILSLARNGRLVTCGATSGYNASTDLRYVFRKQISILGSYMGSKKDMHDVFQFIDQGKLKPVVDTIFPLEKLSEAEKKMEGRNVFGKIILQP